jgi:hypothetical protein
MFFFFRSRCRRRSRSRSVRPEKKNQKSFTDFMGII